MASETIPSLYQKRGRESPEAAAVAVRSATGEWQERSWAEYASEIRSVGRALLSLGVQPGEVVAIYGENSLRWVEVDVATMSIGAISAGIYATCSGAQLAGMLELSRASVIFVGGVDELARVRAINLRGVRAVVVMDTGAAGSERTEGVLGWSTFIELAGTTAEDLFDVRLRELDPSEVAMLVFTSGTTGAARAVKLTHGGLAACTRMGVEMIPDEGTRGRCLSYLPLAHIAERGVTVLGPALKDYTVFFAESIERLPSNLLEVRPTFFLGVPRLYEKIRERLEPRLERAGGLGGFMVRRARATAEHYWRVVLGGGTPGARLERRYRRADRFVLSRIRRALGWNQCTQFISGAAPLALSTLQFFTSIGVLIREVYGLSESGGVATLNRPGDTRLGSVGKPFTGVSIRLEDDGEILLSGPNLFDGYLGEPEATSEVLADGWLRTGDVGRLDDDGFLHITGRKKDLIITAGGKNVSPAPIERRLEEHSLIKTAILIGDGRKYVGALLVPDVAATRGPSGAAGGGTPDPVALRAELQRHVDAVNATLSRPETVKRFEILPRDLDQSRGELTPTQKVVRGAVRRNFADLIEKMYETEHEG